MPTGSRLLVRAALVWLIVGATLGLAHYFDPVAIYGAGTRAHAEVMLVGWMLQFVAGIASWIFPREADVPVDQRPLVRGALLLNASVLAAAVATFRELGSVLPIARCSELIALAMLAFAIVPRIRAPRLMAG